MQQSFWPILCANKKPYHRDYWEAVTVGLFSSFRHKPFLTEKTASLASKQPYAVHTFIHSSIKFHIHATDKICRFYDYSESIPLSAKANCRADKSRGWEGWLQPSAAQTRGALKSSVSSTPSHGRRFISSVLIKKETKGVREKKQVQSVAAC